MKTYYVYILLCSDQSYYTGVTNDLETRFLYHQNGYNPNAYTYNRRPVEIVFYTEFNDINQAIAFEKQIKGWSRKKKEAMMQGNWAEVSRLAQSRTPQPPTPVRPEPVEGLWAASVRGSTSSPRTDSEVPQ